LGLFVDCCIFVNAVNEAEIFSPQIQSVRFQQLMMIMMMMTILTRNAA